MGYRTPSLRRSAVSNRDLVHTFVRSGFTNGALKLGGGGTGNFYDFDFGLNFQLGGAVQNTSGPGIMLNIGVPTTDFVTLFDTYKIASVSVTFIPRFNVAFSDSSNAALAATPQLHWAVDYDDSTAAPLSSLIQYNNYKMTNLAKPFTITLKPRVAIQTYQSGVTTGYTTKGNQWVDMNSGGVEHYGLKGVFRFLDTTDPQLYDVKLTYVFKMKGTI